MPRAVTRPFALNGLMLLNVFISGFHQNKENMISEISPMEKHKFCMILLLYGIFKKKKALETREQRNGCQQRRARGSKVGKRAQTCSWEKNCLTI